MIMHALQEAKPTWVYSQNWNGAILRISSVGGHKLLCNLQSNLK